MTPEPEPQNDRIATMEGAGGDELQFQAVMQRTRELIGQRFDYFGFVAGNGTAIKSNNSPYIQLSD